MEKKELYECADGEFYYYDAYVYDNGRIVVHNSLHRAAGGLCKELELVSFHTREREMLGTQQSGAVFRFRIGLYAFVPDHWLDSFDVMKSQQDSHQGQIWNAYREEWVWL